jgi:small GTP-binding protein
MAVKRDDFDQLVKISLVGDTGVGKTSIGLRHRCNIFSLSSQSTIGAEFYSRISKYNDKIYKLQIWDRGGDDVDSNSYISAYYKGSDVVIVVFSMDDRKSFENVEKKWLAQIQKYLKSKNLMLILIGNKTDLNTHKITQHEIDSLKTRCGFHHYFPVSAITGMNIAIIFENVCQYIYNIKPSIEPIICTDKTPLNINNNNNMSKTNETKKSCCVII